MAEIKEGNKAPDFTAIDQDGEKVKLSSFRGEKNVVLYFYPKDMTPGCTTQACDFRDQHKKFKNTVILGVSIDSTERHQKFIAKYDFDGSKSMELRQEYGNRAVEEHWQCLFYHAKSKAIAKVGFENEGFRIL